MMLLPLMIVLSGADAPPQTSAPPQRGETVVVTARRLSDLKAALAACIARGCPPDQEIDATLAVVEQQFVDGDYQGARQTAARGAGRNQRHAAAYPVPVSEMQRAYARIGAHMGISSIHRLASLDMVDALKAGLDDNDDRVLAARIEVADMYTGQRQYEAAQRRYREVARDAERLGRRWIEGAATLRLLQIARAMQVRDSAAEATMAKLEADPAMARFAMASQLMKLRSATSRDDGAALDRFIATLPKMGTKPVLLHAPKVSFPSLTPPRNRFATITTDPVDLPPVLEDQWVDIGLWIAPDGQVSEAMVLRRSPKLAGEWPRDALRAVEARRYSPFQAEAGDPGVFRVERHTLTASMGRRDGSRVAARTGPPTIEILDLTDDLPATAERTGPDRGTGDPVVQGAPPKGA